jgi:hypothetical protein
MATGAPAKARTENGATAVRLAMAQADRGRVVASYVGDVKDVVEDLDTSQSRSNGIGYLHPALQTREAGHVTVESDDLSIHHEVVECLRADGVGYFGIGVI